MANELISEAYHPRLTPPHIIDGGKVIIISNSDEANSLSRNRRYADVYNIPYSNILEFELGAFSAVSTPWPGYDYFKGMLEDIRAAQISLNAEATLHGALCPGYLDAPDTLVSYTPPWSGGYIKVSWPRILQAVGQVLAYLPPDGNLGAERSPFSGSFGNLTKVPLPYRYLPFTENYKDPLQASQADIGGFPFTTEVYVTQRWLKDESTYDPNFPHVLWKADGMRLARGASALGLPSGYIGYSDWAKFATFPPSLATIDALLTNIEAAAGKTFLENRAKPVVFGIGNSGDLNYRWLAALRALYAFYAIPTEYSYTTLSSPDETASYYSPIADETYDNADIFAGLVSNWEFFQLFGVWDNNFTSSWSGTFSPLPGSGGCNIPSNGKDIMLKHIHDGDSVAGMLDSAHMFATMTEDNVRIAINLLQGMSYSQAVFFGGYISECFFTYHYAAGDPLYRPYPNIEPPTASSFSNSTRESGEDEREKNFRWIEGR